MTDGRKRLRANWPPRRINSVRVELDAALYEKVYEEAKADGLSLADHIRRRLAEPLHGSY